MSTHTPAIPRRPAIPVGRLGLIGLAFLALLVIGLVLSQLGRGSGAPVPLPGPVTQERPSVEARGRIVPVTWARISSAVGGRVIQIRVGQGGVVGDREEIVRLDSGTATESVVAPFRGTVASLPVRIGETVRPGDTIAFVGDLSRYQVETTDLDEYSVARVRVGQPVTVRIDALNGTEVAGRVTQVALMAQTGSAGEVTYPVFIDFDPPDNGLRWGMTVRVVFEGAQ